MNVRLLNGDAMLLGRKRHRDSLPHFWQHSNNSADIVLFLERKGHVYRHFHCSPVNLSHSDNIYIYKGNSPAVSISPLPSHTSITPHPSLTPPRYLLFIHLTHKHKHAPLPEHTAPPFANFIVLTAAFVLSDIQTRVGRRQPSMNLTPLALELDIYSSAHH